jgi:glycosyltransferase involved in cell wall biosynthesis
MRAESLECPSILVYLGRRGGGSRLVQEILFQHSLQSDFRLYTCLRTDFFNAYFSDHIDVENIPIEGKSSLIRELLSIEFYLSVFRAYRFLITLPKPPKIVVLMSSPIDCIFGPLLSRRWEVWRVIHDAVRHQGDMWPTNRQIRKWVKRDKTIVLSNAVANQLGNQNSDITVIVGSLSRRFAPEVGERPIDNEYCLIVGRGKRYQIGYDIQELLNSTQIQVCFAGPRVSNKIESQKVIYLERWLTDFEMETLIHHASFVMCLYRESSQSGVVEQSLSHGTPVIATNVGAMPEQIRDGIDGIIIDSCTQANLLEAQLLVGQIDRKKVGANRDKESLYETLINQGFFS